MISHGLRPVGLRFKGYIFEATRTWHVQHEFFDCRCDIVPSETKITFSRRGVTKIKSKQFLEFGSRTTIDCITTREKDYSCVLTSAATGHDIFSVRLGFDILLRENFFTAKSFQVRRLFNSDRID